MVLLAMDWPPQCSTSSYSTGGIVSLDGVTVNGNDLIIAAPQVSHSGIYQCFVSNTFNQEAYFHQSLK